MIRLILGAALVATLAACVSGPRAGLSGEDCFAATFGDMAPDRISRLEAGVRDVMVVAPTQTKTEPFGIVIENNRVPQGAAVINFFADGELFKVAEIVDASCKPARRVGVEGRPGDTTLQNWDTVVFDLEDASYALRLGYTEGRVEANSLTMFVR